MLPASDPPDYAAMTEETCQALEDNGLVDLTTKEEYRIFHIISAVSVFGSIVVFLTTYWNEKLNSHPYKLVSLIALIDATYFMIFNTIDYTCVWDLNEIFSATVFFSLSP